MMTIDDSELYNVTGGGRATPASLGRVPGTTIYAVPPREQVCNREQFDWMAARVGKGVAPHVVAADARLCGFPMPGSSASSGSSGTAPRTGGSLSPDKFLDTMNLDFFSFLR